MVRCVKQLLQEDGEIQEGPASLAAAAKDAEVAAVLSELDDETMLDAFFSINNRISFYL